MKIKYAGDTLQQCPECHHTSVHFFDDVVMCILCGWERKRSEGSRPCASTGGITELIVPQVQRPSKRARQRARKAAVAKKAAKG